MAFPPKAPADAPTPSQNEPKRHADEPDMDDHHEGHDSDALDPRIHLLVDMLGDEGLLADDGQDDLLLMIMRSPFDQPAASARRILH